MSPLVRQKWPWSRRNLTDGLLYLGTDRRRRVGRDLQPSFQQLEDRTLPTATPTLTQLSSSLSSLTYGQADHFTASVTTNPAGSTTPTGGTVTFYDGPTNIGSVPLFSGVASITLDLAAGSHLISATYGGTSSFASSSNTIAAAVISTLASPSVSGSNGTGGSALNAALNQPRAVAVDSSGNLYIADTYHNQVREVLAASGIIINVAGTGTAGDTGDGNLATLAQIDQPSAIALDSAGDIFIVDSIHDVVREVNDSTGRISTVAGSGSSGYSGDGSLASQATLNNPSGIAIDSSGNLYIADTNNDVIREVNHTTRNISTVAGDNSPGYSGDGGPATFAQLYSPSGVAVDTSGNLYIADTDNNVIRYVSASSHTIITLAGTNTLGYSGDGGPPASAQLANPYAVVLDASGDLFISDTANSVIREISSGTGLISTVAGNGSYGSSGAGGAATSASLAEPSGIAVDSSGNLYIASTWSNVIDSVNASTSILTVVAGDGSRNGSGPTPGQGLNNPSGIFIDAAGDIFIADTTHNVVREILASSGLMIIVAGNGTAGYTGDGGQAVNAELNSPADVAVDLAGDLFIADTANNVIREVFASNHEIETIVGSGAYGYYGDGGGGPNASLSGPTGIAVDSTGDLFIADSGNNVIRELSATTYLMSTVAGNGTGGYSGDGGTATAAELFFPLSVTLDSAGDLFITDSGNNAIREVSASTGNISTVAGNGTAGYTGDGEAATAAELNSPSAVAVDSSGNLYIADTANNVIREVNATTGLISTIAGNGTAGSSGDGGLATAAELSDPYGLAIDPSGNLDIADSDNDVIREVSSTQVAAPLVVSVTPAQLTLMATSLSKAYAAALPALTYTITGLVNGDISSVLTGSPTLSTTATATSHVAASPYTITISANTLAGSNYIISTIINGTLTITPVSLTITVPNATKPYSAVLPSLTLSPSNYTGLVNGDTPSSLTTQPTVTTTATATSHVSASPYSITASGALDPDYTITYIPGQLSITPVSLTITAPTLTKPYGSAVPSLTLTASNYTGLVNGDSPLSLTTQPTLNTTATASSHVSSNPYSITASGAIDPDYTITYIPGQLTVSPVSLTITAPTLTKPYGSALPALTLTNSNYTGLVNGDTPSSLTTQPTLNTTATASSHVSANPYSITLSGAIDHDYTITYIAGQLTVTPVSLSVTAPTVTKPYGSALPALTLTASNYTGLVNGDIPSSLTTQPTLTTTATATSHVAGNPYSITASAAIDPDYTITYIPGQLTITPVSLTITAPSLTKPYGSALPSLTLTASNYTGLVNGDTPASLTSPPTVSTTATAASHVAANPYSITASAAIDPDYTITYIQGQLTVTSAALTITAPSLTKPYGSALPSLTLTASNYIGLVNGDTPASLTTQPTLTTTATASSHVAGNPYSITASAAIDPDYTITYIAGQLTVTPVSLTITAPTLTKPYGSALPSLTLTASNYTGLVNGDSPLSLTTQPTITTTATATSHVAANPYSITASGAIDPDYAITYIPGQLTITPVALTITAPSLTKPYGSALPSLTLTASNYTGLVNGDTPASLTTQPVLTSTATATSHVAANPYSITASAAIDPDYTITYIPGQLTITPVALTITAPSLTKVYGASPPSLTLTASNYTGLVNGDTPQSLTIPPSATTVATQFSPVQSGGYATIASGAVDLDYNITYLPGTLTIIQASTTSTITLGSGSTNPSSTNQSVTFEVTVATQLPGQGTATGLVEFYDGNPSTTGQLLGSAQSLLNGQASLSTTTLSATTHAIYVVFVGSTNFGSSTSLAYQQTVVSDATTTTLSRTEGSSNVSTYGETINVEVSISTGTSTLATGTVSFFDGNPSTGGLPLGTVTLSGSSTAVFGITGLHANAHTIYAQYQGAGSLAGSISAPLDQIVNTAPLTITAPSLTKPYGSALPSLTLTASNYIGLVNGDTPSSLTTQPTLSTTATAASHVAANPYPITASGASDSDYAITYVPGQLSITPVSLTITAPTLTKPYGSALPSLTLTASNYTGFVNGDTPASLTTQPVLTTTATATSHVAGNPYSITASAAIDPDYTITYIPGQLTITPVALTIIAPTLTKPYGSTLPALTLTTSNYTGLVNGDTPASLTSPPTVSTTATAASHVAANPYSITASAAIDPDYTITYIPGQLTITPVSLTITAPSLTKVYGASPPALTLTASNYAGLVNGDTPSSLTTQPTLSTTATTASHVAANPYSITASGASDPDYAITYVAGQLTITPVALTITAPTVAKPYGSALPTLTLTASNYTGLVNGDNPASLTTQPTLSTTATASSHVSASPYPITASGAIDPDYTITYIPGQLTITPVALTITAPTLTKPYGSALPSLTLTASNYTGLVNGDNPASLTTQPVLTSTATATSHVAANPYSITASAAIDPDYTITYIAGQLTITPVALTITAPSLTKVYGASPPSLTLTSSNYTGLVNGDTPQSLTIPPSATTVATQFSPVQSGGYATIASGAVDLDYNITYLPGTLTIIQASTTSTITLGSGSTNPSSTNQSVTFEVTVATQLPGQGTATGLVEFYDGNPSTTGQLLGSAQSLLNGQASLSTTTLSATTHAIYVVFVGSTNFGSSTSLAYQQTVVSDATTTTLSRTEGSSNVSTYGETINVEVSISTGTSTLATGTVSFFDGNPSTGGLPLGTVTLSGSSTAVFGITGLHANAHTIYAQYQGAGSLAGSISAPLDQIVNTAPLTITAPSLTKPYGSALPSLTLTASNYIGLVNGDTPSSLTTQPTLSTTATAASHVAANPYPITASGASDSDYAITYLPGQLTVTPVSLTIAADPASSISGQPLPVLTATYTGFVNGDTPSNLATSSSITTTASSSSPAGTYAIFVQGATSSDYTITQLSAILTLTANTIVPTTVVSSSVQSMKVTKHKSAKVIVLNWNSALNSADALNVANFQIATVPKSKKQHAKSIAISHIVYQTGSNSIAIFTTKPLSLSQPLKLTINAFAFLNASGNPIDSNSPGQPGANVVILVTKSGVTIQSN